MRKANDSAKLSPRISFHGLRHYLGKPRCHERDASKWSRKTSATKQPKWSKNTMGILPNRLLPMRCATMHQVLTSQVTAKSRSCDRRLTAASVPLVDDLSFNPVTVSHRDIVGRLKVVSASTLPPGWRAGHFPRPPLPIDECVQVLVNKRRIRQPTELQAIHPLGVCPYAIARHGVVRAAQHAGDEQEKQDKLKPRVLDALKYLKDYGPKVRFELCGAERKVHFLLEASEQLGVSLPELEPLLEAMSRSRRLLEQSSQAIASLHRDLSKHRGNVWRLSFVTALFAEWWVLTAKDPKASPGPCQDFICAAWCSLSTVAAATDADWVSAIKVAKSRCKPGEWRTG
jgi:hypothetical protein